MSNPFIPIEKAELSWRENQPFSHIFADIYFSSDDGLAEAEYVFIQGNQLIQRWQQLNDGECFVIAETGFGSGLNFLLTWFLWLQYAPKESRLYFFSCEKHPLSHEDLQRCFSLWPQLDREAKKFLANYPVLTPGFHYLTFENERVNLTLMLGDALASFNQLLVCGDHKLEKDLRTYFVDAWFLDGFSPAKNADIWSEKLFQVIGLLSKMETTVATFSASSRVKHGLNMAGFDYSKRKGFGKKREMLTAKVTHSPLVRRKRLTPWHVGFAKKNKDKEAIVLGAGLAGCFMAHALAKRGWQVKLLEAGPTIASGASANQQAILYPQLSAYSAPLTSFMLNAYLYAVRFYTQLIKEHPVGELSGIIQLAFNEKEKRTQASLQTWLLTYPELGKPISKEEGSYLAGIELDKEGLWIPSSGWLNLPSLCQLLCQQENITWVPNCEVMQLGFDNHEWQVAGYQTKTLILANGYQANQFLETMSLPLKMIRGQITSITANKLSRCLKIPICGNGHILPAFSSTHAIGATYHLNNTSLFISPDDEKENLSKLEKLASSITWSNKVEKQWVGIRAATPDYLPLVGAVPDEGLFNARFVPLATDSNRWLAKPGIYYPGLFIFAGFGSRGLTSIPLSAEWLAGAINGEPSFMTRSMMQSLAPARFLIKRLIK